MLVLIPESDFPIKTSRKLKELFNSVSFVTWLCLCILFTDQVIEKDVDRG